MQRFFALVAVAVADDVTDPQLEAMSQLVRTLGVFESVNCPVIRFQVVRVVPDRTRNGK